MTHAERELLFLDLFRENKSRILRLCSAYLNSTDDAEDLFQDIMTNVWHHLPGFRQEAKASTWLYRIAVNTALIYRRKRKPAQVLKNALTDVPDGGPGAQRNLIAGMNFTEPSLDFIAHAMARLRGDRPRFRKQCALLAFSAAGGINFIYLGILHGAVSHRIAEHLAGTAAALVAWRLGLWLREKRDAAERRPLLAQPTAIERALQALQEGVA